MTAKPVLVWEIAEIEVLPGTEEKFEAGVAEAEPLFLRAAAAATACSCAEANPRSRRREGS